MILSRFRSYVREKMHIIPSKFYMRYRQIMFFKIVKYVVQKKQRKKIKTSFVSSNNHQVLKTYYMALIENIFLNKKKRMINATVKDFRRHQLREKSFKILKIFSLKKK